MKRILFTGDTLSDSRRDEFKNQGFDIISAPFDLKEEDLCMLLKECDGYILGGDEIVNKSVIDNHGNRLKAISFFGAGYEKYIDASYAKTKGIMVANTPAANADSVAEFTIALMNNIIKNISYNAEELKKGKWLRPKTFDIASKTVGIIGMGNIGNRVAKILYSGYGANIIYTSRKSKLDVEAKYNAKKVSLVKLLAESDIISLHLNLSEETTEMISFDEFNSMKSGVYIVNTARAELINKDALYQALCSGKVAGCAFDGFYEEPVTETVVLNNPLLSLPNNKYLVTPHMAYYTQDAIDKMEDMALKNIFDMLTKGKCDNMVN